MGRGCGPCLSRPRPPPARRCTASRSYLGQEQGLGGSGDDYYHPRNGYLPWAMEFRSGLPITLTLIYMLVGMRLNIPVEGIAAPGHFLARLDGIIFDPYRQGRILSDGEWEMIASRSSL